MLIEGWMGTHTNALLQEGEDTAAKIPGADYERRLLLLSATCIAWSPIVATANDSAATAGASAGTGSFALLAVGTKAGRVWLWRYRPPQLAVAADLFAECKCLQMVRPVGWIAINCSLCILRTLQNSKSDSKGASEQLPPAQRPVPGCSSDLLLSSVSISPSWGRELVQALNLLLVCRLGACRSARAT